MLAEERSSVPEGAAGQGAREKKGLLLSYCKGKVQMEPEHHKLNLFYSLRYKAAQRMDAPAACLHYR